MVKVKLNYNGQIVEVELNRDAPLQPAVDAACTSVNAPGLKSEYALQLETNMHYISQQDWSNPGFKIDNGSVVLLKLNPSIGAQKAVAALRDPAQNKKAIFDLQKTYLQDDVFAQAFLKANGLPEIIKFVAEAQGNILSYALKALHGALKPKIGWEAITEIFLTTSLFPQVNSTNINVCKNALECAALIAQSDKIGFVVVDRCIRASSIDKPYATIVAALSSTDVGIQANAMELVNALYISVPDAVQQKALDETLDVVGIIKPLRKIVKQVQDERLKLQAYIYQALKLRRLSKFKEVPYDKNNPQHEEILMKLWTTTFPNEQLQSRVSEQWKKMGFQGTDPATDFRGMGLLGLLNLVYFAETYADDFRGIVKRNIERKEREYPGAVAGINVTQMLFELLNVGKSINFNGPPLKIFRIIFDHQNAFEEMYCKTFLALDRVWDEMNASYMDFPKVIAAVRKQIETIFESNPTNMDTFTRALSNEGGFAENEEDDTEHPQLKAVKAAIRKETFEMYQQQKLEFLKDGGNFKLISAPGKGKEKEDKAKTKTHQYIFLKADTTLQTLSWGNVNTEKETTANLPSQIPKATIKGIVTGREVPSIVKSKKEKFEEADIKRTFALLIPDAENALELQAHNQTDYLTWVDALRIFLGLPVGEKENQDELKQLSDMFIQVRLLDLAGVTIPEEGLVVPPPPTSFDFVTGDDSSSTGQAQQLAVSAEDNTTFSNPASPQLI